MGLLTLFNVVAVLGFIAEAQADCPALFKRFSKDHTYCKPANPTCNVLRSFVTKDDIATILREHNAYRSKVATGKEQKLPKAANMLQMVWDDELAAVAQKHASLCAFEHDCNNCRRVQNFGVGQNLAKSGMTYSSTVPDADWRSAIKGWYDEVKVFNRDAIDKFIPPPPKPTYGHFSQVIWAESWRVGCGYVLFKEGDKYIRIYTCNYGPGGNMYGGSLYKQGPPCSACPVNSCCDKTCGSNADYSGLCKITDDRGPTYKPQGDYVFYCDFQSQKDCLSSVTGENKWLIYNSLSGNYLSIVLSGGQESAMTFVNKVKSSASSICVVTNYRKGPNVDGEEDSSEAKEIFTIVSQNFAAKATLNSVSPKMRQQFTKFSMDLGWNMETELKLTFSVPAGKPDQFLEISSIYVLNGRCPK